MKGQTLRAVAAGMVLGAFAVAALAYGSAGE